MRDFERKMLADRRCGFCGAKVAPTTDEQRDFVRRAVERGGPALQCAECARSQRTLYGDGPGDVAQLYAQGDKKKSHPEEDEE